MMTDVLETPPPAIAAPAPGPAACFHCGADCPDAANAVGYRLFCCAGCRTVYEILQDNGLQRFYELETSPGLRLARIPRLEDFAYLEDENVRRKLLDFSDGQTARVTFHIPAIHCIACVWLLENLFRLKPGLGRSEVNFPRREVSLEFSEKEVSLAEIVALLASLGYEPALHLNSLEAAPPDPTARRLVLKIGLAGFAFGNIMLLSFPTYLGLNPATEATLQRFFGLVSLLLALPVLLYSASDYWKSAWTCLRQRMITIELPIALGIAALFTQSAYDILARRGEGYLDSFSGLLFLLLCGKWFQRKTYATLSFERDYKSYFPLSVIRKTADGEATAPITSLSVGDRVIVRSQELIPADAVLRSGAALIDYSFVTGESAPVEREAGDYVYAGGRQAGGAIELEIVKAVSQSYLTSLWNRDAFQKSGAPDLNNLLNTAGRYFTYAVVFIALAVAAYWSLVNPAVAIRAFSSVLIVACPCALALASPFTLGSALRILGRHHFYARNTSVVEAMSKLTAVVFDKTGTLTSPRESEFAYEGSPLTAFERNAVGVVARHSTHPHSRTIGKALDGHGIAEEFIEIPGLGVEGYVQGRLIRLGSRIWTGAHAEDDAASVHVAADGVARGRFRMKNIYRPTVPAVVAQLGPRYKLAVISGDHAREKSALREIYGPASMILFQQSPHEKLDFIRRWQDRGERVLMLGDGLNDAGALKQSNVGVAVTEDVATFSPACDAILDARHFGQIPGFLRFSRHALAVLKAAFVLSLLYNAAGLSFAAAGKLSPLVSAVLMPLSSFSVIAFSLGATRVAAWRAGLR